MVHGHWQRYQSGGPLVPLKCHPMAAGLGSNPRPSDAGVDVRLRLLLRPHEGAADVAAASFYSKMTFRYSKRQLNSWGQQEILVGGIGLNVNSPSIFGPELHQFLLHKSYRSRAPTGVSGKLISILTHLESLDVLFPPSCQLIEGSFTFLHNKSRWMLKFIKKFQWYTTHEPMINTVYQKLVYNVNPMIS